MAEAPGVGVGLSVAAIVVFFVSPIALLLVLVLALGRQTVMAMGLPLEVILQVVGLAAAILLLRVRGIALVPIIGRLRPLGRMVATGVGIGLLTFLVAHLGTVALLVLAGSSDVPDQAIMREVVAGGATLAFAVIAAVVLAPLAEELLFRGLLYRGLRDRMRVVPATLISSVLFAVIHIEIVASQPLGLVALVLAGAVMAIAYERTGSLLLPVVIHATYNGVGILLVVTFGRLGDELLPEGPVTVALLRSVGAW